MLVAVAEQSRVVLDYGMTALRRLKIQPVIQGVALVVFAALCVRLIPAPGLRAPCSRSASSRAFQGLCASAVVVHALVTFPPAPGGVRVGEGVGMMDPGAIALVPERPRGDRSLHPGDSPSWSGSCSRLLTLKTGYYGTPTISPRASRSSTSRPGAPRSRRPAGLAPRRFRFPGRSTSARSSLSLVPALLVTKGPNHGLDGLGGAPDGVPLLRPRVSAAGESPELTSSILAGVAVVTLVESVVVFHDYFFSSQWFPDPMEGRARGTFKANGQLGAYGFCAAGLLLSFGPDPWPRAGCASSACCRD